MKKLLLIFLSVSSFMVSAQNQKIALIEPREGEGSTAISGMEKAMVRGELRKAIVNHTGFEAFTRADIDQLMKEQDFQRTGNVSESDIHRMGEMSGADYLCISTLNKSSDEFYLEAYLINVETGAISNPASQYGELVNGKLANMLPICQALAQELLGTNTPVAQPIINQVNSKNSRSAHSDARNSSLQMQTPQNASLSKGIGELKVFPDGSRGIVFYIAGDGHGIAVSLQETKAQWDISRKRDIIDIPEIPNLSNAHADASALGEGAYYTSSILRHLPSYQCPAAAWCVSLGEGWYLPSAPELLYLFQIANGKLKQKGPISQALMQNGGVVLDGGWYWTSSESEKNGGL